jgi:hypothetical protein
MPPKILLMPLHGVDDDGNPIEELHKLFTALPTPPAKWDDAAKDLNFQLRAAGYVHIGLYGAEPKQVHKRTYVRV